MGLHRHVRICVNFEKRFTRGGDERDYLLKQIQEEGINFDAVPYGVYGPFEGMVSVRDVKNVTFIFIKRHRCHFNRTIEKIVSFKCKNGIVTEMCTVTPWIKAEDGEFYPVVVQRNDPLYRTDINKFDLFKIVKPKDGKAMVPAGYHYAPSKEQEMNQHGHSINVEVE